MNRLPIIQFLWIGPILSRMEQLSLLSFMRNGHIVHLYCYADIENVPDGVVIMDADNIVCKDRIFKYKSYDSYAGFANLFRYKLLLEKGGIWADMDMVCIRPIYSTEKYLFASERTPVGKAQINNCLIQAPAHSAVMEYCYKTANHKNRENLLWGETGPRLLTDAVVQHGLGNFVVQPDVFCAVNWWDSRLFIKKPLNELISENTFSLHLYHEAWRRDKIDKDKDHDYFCAYEELLRIYEVQQLPRR